MNTTSIKPADDGGTIRIEGELGFQNVAELNPQGQALIASATSLEFDLAGVVRVDSAGLALLVEWMRNAQTSGKSIRFLNVPPQMLAIARVSGLDQVLPLVMA